MTNERPAANPDGEPSAPAAGAGAPRGGAVPGVGPRDRSLHPFSWLFTLWTELRRIALPIAALAFASTRWSLWDFALLPLAIPIVIYAVIRQLSLRYTLGETDLVVRRSLVIHRSERHIPYARIHNLRVVETPLHRLLHVVEVAVETASGTEPEATLRVLSHDALEELRTHVAARSQVLAPPGRARDRVAARERGREPGQGLGPAAGQEAGPALDQAADASPREVVLSFSLRDAITYGALDNRGFVIVAALAGFAWEAVSSWEGGQPWDPQFWHAPLRLWRNAWGWLQGANVLDSPLTLMAMLAGALVVLKLFSIAWALVTLHGFRVERARSSLSVTHGLLTRASTMIPLHRIQQIKVREKPLHRLAGKAEVELDTVGGGGDQGSRQPVWLAPLAPRAAVSRLLADAGVPIVLDDVAWQRVHPRAARRMRSKALLVAFLGGLLLWTVVRQPWTLAAAALATPILLGIATLQARHLGYALAGPCILLRRGWLWRTIYITWVDRVQALAVEASPFDRRHDMAALIVDTAAGGAMGADLRVPYLGAHTARTLQHELAAGVAATRFQW